MVEIRNQTLSNQGGFPVTVLLYAPVNGAGVDRIVELLTKNRIPYSLAHIGGLVEPQIQVGQYQIIGFEEIKKSLGQIAVLSARR